MRQDLYTILSQCFFGSHVCGHWFFCIINESNFSRTLYCIDPLPNLSEKREMISNFLHRIGYYPIEILHAPCIQQCKLECGPRTIVSIHDIIDQLINGAVLGGALRTLNTYHISSHAYASHARSWLFCLLDNDLPKPPQYCPVRRQCTPIACDIQTITPVNVLTDNGTHNVGRTLAHTKADTRTTATT